MARAAQWKITLLGILLGAQPGTFSGLSGIGDLIVTCMSRYSRNRHVGEEIGKGRKLDEVLSEMAMVAEGVATTRSAYDLARKHNVELPIITEAYEVLFKGEKPDYCHPETLDSRCERGSVKQLIHLI